MIKRFSPTNLRQILIMWFVDFFGIMENMTEEIGDAIDGHTENTNNPHGVTALQVGAYTKAEVDRLISRPSDTNLMLYYGLVNKQTVTTKDASGNTVRIEESDDYGTVVTTFASISGGKQITSVVTPTDGDVYYTKTTTISADGLTVAESYTTSQKQTTGGE